ncbi:uncharacterized protein BDZ99DRAFT_518812 [Mytilinidion resinicola]|uniref:Protein kinase domain-containing protein n=1 Tax=Mytilinidion resinicola TaxID=574789 RepID=A0A6A6YT59_9PEZI|nr:uncharacterized protein BDZ99DRAFT_518812 [Mytilinidion resinicola]KAF2811553.1 hypothetical protein BDZ99DRAFT_518812 [Mytilinidion resinicola]
MAGLASPSSSKDLCERFKDKLATEWKREAACGAEYKDKQFFIDTDRLTKWMLRQDTDKRSTHAAILLLEAYHRNHREIFQPAFSNLIFTGDNRCILVFSILLTLDKGDLVDIFQKAKIVDKNLEFAHTFYKELEEDLKMKNIQDAARIITEFEKAKWSYCPAPVRMDMEEKFHGGKWILPFCRRQSINTKGGTAEVYQVSLQEDLVPDDMKKVIWRSKYVDKDYGVCYRLALKSFAFRNQHFYTWERNAFLGIRGKKGMVQYLGDFSFDGAPYDPTSRTHNILLEYGDQDLDEYFADEESYPPVLTTEITVFWKSLFKVADAISTIHTLPFRYEDGSIELYHGWHADVKPDNILRVHGEFKLADFGFAKFKRKGETVPTEVIEGGTQTYGSPECDQGRVRAGTITPVTQTIDTWSYGCVLSITATWVVLGFQGVRQFEAFRMRAIKKLKKQNAKDRSISTPTADDAFHDGKEPLPEVLEWHNYLRGHLRCSDTVTPRVLNLVDEAMLLANPRRRITSEKLCKRLEDILIVCEDERSKRNPAMDPDKSVLEALLEYEKKPRQTNTARRSYTTRTPSGTNTDSRGSSLRTSGDRQYRKSKRVGKFEKLDNVPHAQTAGRAEMLEEELEQLKAPSIVVQTRNDAPSLPSNEAPKLELDTVYENGYRDLSPDPTRPRRRSRYSERRQSPSKPMGHTSVAFDLPTVPTASHTVGQDSLYDSPLEHDEDMPGHTPYRGRQPIPRNPGLVRNLSQGSTAEPKEDRLDAPGVSKNHATHPEPRSAETSTIKVEDSSRYAVPTEKPDASPGSTQRQVQQDSVGRTPFGATKSPVVDPASVQASGQNSFPPVSLQPHAVVEELETQIDQSGNETPQSQPSALDSASDGHFKVKPRQEEPTPSIRHDDTTNIPPPLLPDLNGVSMDADMSYLDYGTSAPFPHPEQDEVADEDEGTNGAGQNTVPPVMLSVPSASPTEIDPSFDIYQVRQELDKIWPTGMGAKLLSFAGLTPTKKDSILKLYIKNRDIKFVVDNGTTMLPFWDVATFVIETLTMKLAGLDDDGLDLVCTLGDISLENEKGLHAPSNFRNAMNRARPSSDGDEKTDMRETLEDIFEDYLTSRKAAKDRKMTLIVLTDGIWKGSVPPESVGAKIEEFVKQLHTLKDRAFSIQFIRFGDDEEAIERLRRLDDDLPKKPGMRDIIDTVPWTGKVRKMIIGSFNAAEDAEGGILQHRGSPSLSTPDPPMSMNRTSTDLSRHKPKRLSRVSSMFNKREGSE